LNCEVCSAKWVLEELKFIFIPVEVPRKIPSPVAGYNRDPVPVSRVQKDISDAKRRELLVKSFSIFYC